MVGQIGSCNAIEPIFSGGDSVIRVKENLNQSVTFPDPESITQTITESVTVNVT
jgi:hypothetical protein